MNLRNIKEKLKAIIISTLSVSLISTSVFTTAANALAIDNIAQASYEDSNGKVYNVDTNKQSTDVKSNPNLNVTDQVLVPIQEGQPKGIFLFPAFAKNTGIQIDDYVFSIPNLQNGLVATIYLDKNGNGTLEPDEQQITSVNGLKPNETINLIIKIEDTLGYPSGTILDLSLLTQSKTDATVSASSPFKIKFIPSLDEKAESPKPNQFAQPKETTLFPVKVTNTGVNTDNYDLSIDGIPNGVIPKIYYDKNCDGILDPATDDLVQNTGIMFKGDTKCFIVSLQDTIGLPLGTVLNPIFNSKSTTDNTITVAVPLTLTIGSPPSSGGGGGGSSNPTPTPSPSVSFEVPKIRVTKTGFPQGRVKVNEDLSYYIEVFNDSNITSRVLYLMDKLPSGLILDKDTITASDDGVIEFSMDGKSWISTYTPCKDSVTCVKYLRVKWTKISPLQTYKVYFKTKVDGYVDDAISNTAWVELPNATDTKSETPNGLNNTQTVRIDGNTVVVKVPNEIYVIGTVFDKKSSGGTSTNINNNGDENSQTLAGILVQVFDKNGRKVGQEVTGETGIFKIPVPEKGDYTIVYRKATPNDKTESYLDNYSSNKDVGTKKAVFEVFTEENQFLYQKGMKVDKLDANPVPIHISGKVKDSQTQQVIKQAKIQLFDENKRLVNETVTDDKGEYIFNSDAAGNPLKEGKYLVAVTNAAGYVTYVSVNVKANDGDVVIAEDLLIDPFGIVYDELGGETQRINGASVYLLKDCSDISISKLESKELTASEQTKLVSLDSLGNGEKQNNPYITKEEGTYQFFMNKNQLDDKTYCLVATAPDYYTRIFTLRLKPVNVDSMAQYRDEKGNIVKKKVASKRYVAEILDDRGKKTTISNIESIPYKIPLRAQKTITLDKKVNRPVIETGESATYIVETQNKLKFTLKDTLMTDLLPKGFSYVDNSLRIQKADPGATQFKNVELNSLGIKNFKASDKLSIDLGDFLPEQKFRIVYQARAGINADSGQAINEAYITARTKADTTLNEGPAQAVVVVKKGIFGKNGTILGRVSLDGVDPSISGLESIALYTPNGIRVLTDNKGKFSIQDVPPGDFVLHIDKASFPPNVYMIKEAIEKAEANNKKINELVKNEINIDSFPSLVYMTDKPIKFTSNKNKISANTDTLPEVKKYKITLTKELKKDSKEEPKDIDLELGKTYLPKDLGLNKSGNIFKIKITENNKLIKQQKSNFWYMPLNYVPKKPTWIGEDDIIARIDVTESGLSKGNFRLAKVEPLDLPDENAINFSNDTLSLVYAYPAKFTTKEIKYITYPDIQNHWAKDTIEYESGLEIIHGYPDGSFRPARSITKAEAVKLTLVAMKSFDVKMGTNFTYEIKKPSKVTVKIFDEKNNLVKLFYEDLPRRDGRHILSWDGKDENGKLLPIGKYFLEVQAKDKDENYDKLKTFVEIVPAIGNYKPEGSVNFSDMKGHWSNPFIKVGLDENIIDKPTDNNFKPDSFISRYEMAVMAVKSLKIDVSNVEEKLEFKDSKEIPEWARKYVSVATQKDLLPKFSDNMFRPKRPISRAEIAVLVKNLINQQKIQNLLRGSANKELTEISIDENKIPVNGNIFEIPLLDNPGLEVVKVSNIDKKTYYDEKYANKTIFSSNTNNELMPIPEEEITVNDWDKIASEFSEEKKEDVKPSFFINLNNKEKDEYYFDNASANVEITTENSYNSKIFINGQEIPQNKIGKRDTNTQTQIKTFTYYGLSLNEGKNEIEGYSVDPNGRLLKEKKISKTIYVRGYPDKFEVAKVKIPADGKTPREFVISAFDKLGIPATDDAIITVKVESGEIRTKDINDSIPGTQVKLKEGKAVISVVPPNTVMTSKVFMEWREFKQEGSIEYSTPLREPILVLGANVNSGYYFTDTENTAKLNKEPIKYNASVFTQGTVFDDYLLTFAADAKKKLNQTQDQFDNILADRTLDEKVYPLYGDSSQVMQVANANSNVFFKVEKDKSHIMWGDFSSSTVSGELGDPKLSLYGRNLTGAKLAFNVPEMTNFEAFASPLAQTNIEDDIRGAGVSGPYYLSKYPIVPGTERISFVEVDMENDLLRDIQPRAFVRGVDYTIDYSSGILSFTQPVSSVVESKNSSNGNKNKKLYIHVSYDYSQLNVYNTAFGAKLSQKLPFGLAAGINYAGENLGTGNKPYQVWGANISEKFSNYFNIMAEYAGSYNETKIGSAYGLGINSAPTDKFTVSANYTRTDENFINKTNGGSAPNSQRITSRVDFRPFDKTSLGVDFNNDIIFASEKLKTKSSINQNLKTTLTQDFWGNSLNLGGEWRRSSSTVDNTSSILDLYYATFGYKSPSFSGFALTLNRDQLLNPSSNLADNKGSVTTIGADIPLGFQDLKLIAKYNLYDTSIGKGFSLESNPLQLSLDKTINTGNDYVNNININTKYSIPGVIGRSAAQNVFGMGAKFGLPQDFSIGFNYETNSYGKEIYNSLINPVKKTEVVKETKLGIASYDATSISLEWVPKNVGFRSALKWDSRFGGDASNLFTLNAGGAIGDDFGVFGNFSISNSTVIKDSVRNNNKGLLGLAYRPLKDDFFNAFVKYELRNKEEGLIEFKDIINTHVFSFDGFFDISNEWSLALKLADQMPTTKNKFLDNESMTNITLGLARITYRFSYNYDFISDFRSLVTFTESGFQNIKPQVSLQLGYYPMKDLRIGIGYNLDAYQESLVKDLIRDTSYFGQGPFVNVSFKLGRFGSFWGQEDGSYTKKDMLENSKK
ncbi:MAG: S-layer homology domain-containing protein [Candidatus Sericytochromatia bacterium]